VLSILLNFLVNAGSLSEEDVYMTCVTFCINFSFCLARGFLTDSLFFFCLQRPLVMEIG